MASTAVLMLGLLRGPSFFAHFFAHFGGQFARKYMIYPIFQTTKKPLKRLCPKGYSVVEHRGLEPLTS